uniref:Ycf39 n=1 Tax=Vacuolaria virescens TaxID=44451 RepID=UPI0021140F54|nr:Ycf39 [Vacuolaria virescens]UTE94677.1 Ycf39 [Vacuolaria virescens]
MTLLIIGGTGTLGRQIVKKAVEEGFKVRCLVRNRKKGNFLQELGAQLIYGDLSIPETLPLCFKGVTSVIDTSTTRPDDIKNLNEIDCDGKLALIRVAEIVKVKRFIFFSILNAEKYPDIPLMEMKVKIEETIKNSSISYTIFRLAGFYQALINQYAIPVLDQQPIWTTAESFPLAYIDSQDAATICLKSLLIKNSVNKTFFLGGPKLWVSADIIQVCEKLSGQKAKLKFIPIAFLKFVRQFTNLFEWTYKISERLSFVDLLEEKNNFSQNKLSLYQIFDLNEKDFLSLENYLQEYFERILKTLNDLNFEQTSKQRDLIV